LAGTAVWLLILGWVGTLVAAQPSAADLVPGGNEPAQPATKAAPQPAAKTPAEPGAKVTPKPDAAPKTVPATPPAKPAVPPATSVPPAKPAVGKDGKPIKEEPPPAPESFYLSVEDPNTLSKWSIYCTYYGPKKGVRPGTAVVPIIMLHSWEGQSSEYADVAMFLQSYGFASIVPDLRGHGRSLNVVRRRLGKEENKTVKAGDLTPEDIANLVRDIAKVKSVLVDKHNKGELNIELLTVMGAEVGCVFALNWTALDWTVRESVYKKYKQGHDVKFLILLSPETKFRRLATADALKVLAAELQISVMLAVGNEGPSYKEAKRLYDRFTGLRPPVDPKERAQKQTVFLIEAPTRLEGTKLLDPQLEVRGMILKFFGLRFLSRLDQFPQWMLRESL